jgi:hypothetical protein
MLAIDDRNLVGLTAMFLQPQYFTRYEPVRMRISEPGGRAGSNQCRLFQMTVLARTEQGASVRLGAAAGERSIG